MARRWSDHMNDGLVGKEKLRVGLAIKDQMKLMFGMSRDDAPVEFECVPPDAIQFAREQETGIE